MNVGTIVEAARVKVRLGRNLRGKPGTVLPKTGRVLGEIEDEFADTLTVGDTFLFAGETLRFEGLAEDEALVTRAPPGTDPAIPSYAGSKFPLSTFLAARVRAIIADPFEWDRLPTSIGDYLVQQRRRSVLPGSATCWSRPSRAASATTSRPSPSRGGSPTRRWACCSPGASNGRGSGRSASRPTITASPSG